MNTSELSGASQQLGDFLQDSDNVITARLSKTPLPADVEQIQLTDLVECDFPGYAAKRLTVWDNIDYDDELSAGASSGPLSWSPKDMIEAQTITAVYLTIRQGAGAEVLLWAIPCVPPVTLDSDDDVFLHEWEGTYIDQ